MVLPKSRYNKDYDLSNCDAEPLRFIRSCQDHAILLVLYTENMRIKACSENASKRFGLALQEIIGMTPDKLFTAETIATLSNLRSNEDCRKANPISNLRRLQRGGWTKENIIAHYQDDLLILELEARDELIYKTDFLLAMDESLHRIQSAQTEESVMNSTAVEIKNLTGFDRTMIYRFDEDYNGDVIAEAKERDMPSFLHLRYPHTDIPKQARELYLSEQIRQVVSTRENSDSLLVSDDDAPINLQKISNRGVSPIHLQYLRLMGVQASLSVAIIVDQKLWGLIACHHREEKLIDFRLRQVLGLFGRVVSGHLALEQSSAFRRNILQTDLARTKLVEQMQQEDDLWTALVNSGDKLKDLVRATGVAVKLEEEVALFGDCPTPEEIDELLALAEGRKDNYWVTDQLHADYPPSKDFRHAPAGLLVIRLVKSPGEYIMWFRPEIVRTIAWGGRPEDRKLVQDGIVQLSPDASFARYTEQKEGQSRPWDRHHVDAVINLRNDIKEMILVKFQEVRKLNDRLVLAYEELEGFSYTVSHDLRAPLRSIKGYAEILQEDYQDKLDEYGSKAINIIVENVNKMNQFINDILEFSRLGRSQITLDAVSLPPLLDEVWQDLNTEETGVELKLDLSIDVLPSDYTLLRQLLMNLIGNAIKYRREIPDAWVMVRTRTTESGYALAVIDNGIGFKMKYADRIFAVFQRLVPDSKYPGTGVGLAIVRRIVEKHSGTISVNSQPNKGTQFVIDFPHPPASHHGEEE